MRQILHLSDVHFGPPHVPAAVDAVFELLERRRPDLVVVSGDLTQRAKPRQFRAARAFVDRIEALGLPTLTVPGNHDVPMYRLAFMERLFSPYGAYRRHFARDLAPSYRDEEMWVVGVNTAFNWTVRDGRFTRVDLRRTAAELDAAPPGVARIVVAHHHMVPPPRYDTQRVSVGAREAAEAFSRSGAELVLSGHLHQSWIGSTEAYYPSGRRPVLLVHSGTSTSDRGRGVERRRNTCNWLRVGRREIAISTLSRPIDGGPFRAVSRHRYPRRDRETYALED